MSANASALEFARLIAAAGELFPETFEKMFNTGIYTEDTDCCPSLDTKGGLPFHGNQHGHIFQAVDRWNDDKTLVTRAGVILAIAHQNDPEGTYFGFPILTSHYSWRLAIDALDMEDKALAKSGTIPQFGDFEYYMPLLDIDASTPFNYGRLYAGAPFRSNRTYINFNVGLQRLVSIIAPGIHTRYWGLQDSTTEFYSAARTCESEVDKYRYQNHKLVMSILRHLCQMDDVWDNTGSIATGYLLGFFLLYIPGDLVTMHLYHQKKGVTRLGLYEMATAESDAFIKWGVRALVDYIDSDNKPPLAIAGPIDEIPQDVIDAKHLVILHDDDEVFFPPPRDPVA